MIVPEYSPGAVLRGMHTSAQKTDGCYQYTLFVTHWDNGSPPRDIEDPDDVAIVSWWINVESDDEPNDVRDCLTSGAQ